MRSSGTAQEWERRRRLEVTERSVHRCLDACRQTGDLDALKAKASPGRPRKLTRRQEWAVLDWRTKSPTVFGFAGAVWTSRLLAALIERRWGLPLQRQLSGRMAKRALPLGPKA
jgi:transposase